MKKTMFTLVAVAALCCAVPAAQASTVVFEDGGTIGSFKLTNLGGGTVQLSLLLSGSQNLNQINNVSVGPFNALFTPNPIVLNVTSLGGGAYSVTTTTLHKAFDDGSGGTAALDFNLNSAFASTHNAFLDGVILANPTNTFAGFDFSKLPGGDMNFALSTSGGTSLSTVFSTTGASTIGTVAFTESNTVPAPGTLTMASTFLVGMGVVVAVKRRKAIAA
jgi:hypothetical protein